MTEFRISAAYPSGPWFYRNVSTADGRFGVTVTDLAQIPDAIRAVQSLQKHIDSPSPYEIEIRR